MRPERLDVQLAPGTVLSKRGNPAAILKTFRKIGVQFGRNLAVPTLRFRNAGDGDELVGYSTISSE